MTPRVQIDYGPTWLELDNMLSDQYTRELDAGELSGYLQRQLHIELWVAIGQHIWAEIAGDK